MTCTHLMYTVYSYIHPKLIFDQTLFWQKFYFLKHKLIVKGPLVTADNPVVFGEMAFVEVYAEKTMSQNIHFFVSDCYATPQVGSDVQFYLIMVFIFKFYNNLFFF